MCHKNLAPLSRRRSLTCHSSICFIAQDSLAQNYTSVKLGLAVNIPLPSISSLLYFFLILGKVMNQEFGTFHPVCIAGANRRRSWHFHGARIRVKVSNLQEVESMGNFFSPLVWASSLLLRRLSKGELPRWTEGGIRIFVPQFSITPFSFPPFAPFPSFTHPLPAVLVKPGNSLLNYRRGGKTGEEEEREKEKEVVNFEPFPTNTPNYS